MIRRLLTPRWIVVHLGVLALVILMSYLAFWQLSRLDQKKSFNATLTAHSTAPVLKVEDIVSTDIEVIEWRRVELSGSYMSDKIVTVINRSQNGAAGYDVLVPFRTTTNQTFLVNKGFMQLSMPLPTLRTTPLTVLGYIRDTQSRGTLGAIDSTDAAVREFQRFDIPLIAERLGVDTPPLFVQLRNELPAPTEQWPAPVSLPELNEGTHLSYAVQWFFFALTALVAWVVVVRRKMREVTETSAPSHTSA
jgi:cytochrome oxidase assembly protein ShyY1